MGKKGSKKGNDRRGIAPNILLKHVESTAPFLFQGELDSKSPGTEFIEKLRFYKKNLKLLNNIDLPEYFHICLCAHWSTAGTFVPTDVDNQIRESLWKQDSILKYIDKMAKLTMESWKWDYSQVTNRKSYNRINNEVMSTHEGTWLSVAIGGYCALVKNKRADLASEMAELIIAEARKEEALLLQLREDRDHINFLRAAPLMAHNFGDLDRVMIQWNMDGSDPFFKEVFKLGHELNSSYDPILVYTGKVNKEFSSKENHRHMSMRQPKCLRKSSKFLIPVGPFTDDWGKTLGQSELLDDSEKAEIVAAFYEGYKRQDQAFGYIRAFRALTKELDQGLSTLEQYLPFDLLAEIKSSPFMELSKVTREEFEADYAKRLEEFVCPNTKIQF
ncbi:MAG: hypothetical protein CME70_23260 [Halobacteriovorax sp.]|nr:hypothetical protein [Halobacteriovorax sp.]|tara:strand:- start:87271 stop:88434 length:1164 start_codon:yes stop_codon:yes gene_type:complete